MTPDTVRCDNDVTVTVTGHLWHKCPYKDERDFGTITATWKPAGQTFELHSLRDYLNTWAEASVSHESITDRIRHDLTTTTGVTAVTVSTTWDTASFKVHVQGGEGHALLREPVNAAGQ